MLPFPIYKKAKHGNKTYPIFFFLMFLLITVNKQKLGLVCMWCWGREAIHLWAPSRYQPFPKSREPVLLSLHWTALICFPLIKVTPLTWTQISNDNKPGANISMLPLQQKLSQFPLTLLFPHPQEIQEEIPAFPLCLCVTAHGWFHL